MVVLYLRSPGNQCRCCKVSTAGGDLYSVNEVSYYTTCCCIGDGRERLSPTMYCAVVLYRRQLFESLWADSKRPTYSVRFGTMDGSRHTRLTRRISTSSSPHLFGRHILAARQSGARGQYLPLLNCSTRSYVHQSSSTVLQL